MADEVGGVGSRGLGDCGGEECGRHEWDWGGHTQKTGEEQQAGAGEGRDP